jgi:uncharacterized protein
MAPMPSWGLSSDGGWWALGLARHDPGVLDGIPMSLPSTGACQRDRLADLGLRSLHLPELRDVDTVADAWAVAEEVPESTFAGVLRSFSLPRVEKERWFA